MAKKYKYRRLVDQIVLFGYDYGIWQSAIVHTIVLLILALTFQAIPYKKQPIKLTLSFISEIEETIDFSAPVEIVSETIQDSSVDTISEILDIESSSQENEIVDIDVSDIVEEKDDIQKDSFIVNANDLTEILASESIDESSNVPDANNKQIVSVEPKKNRSTGKKLSPEKQKQYSSNKPQKKSLFGYDSLLGPGTNTAAGTEGSNTFGGIQNEQAIMGEVDRRIGVYGAKTGDIQISLAWNTADDLDLHVLVQPINSRISWMSRVGRCGGMLDIDMNAHPSFLNNRPIENIYWEYNTAPFNQEYTVGVHFYRSWTGLRTVEGIVKIKVDNNTKIFPVTVTIGQPVVIVTTFKR